MAKRTASEIYQAARAAGFSAAQATIATAVALAESSGDDTIVGDVSLQNNTWGPSVGLWQVRTLKADTGQGTDRDVQVLQGNPLRQAQAAYRISGQGADWSPWSVYTSGAYRQYLGQASQVATTLVGNGWIPYVPDPGDVLELPGEAGKAVGDLLSKSIKPARQLLLTLGVVAFGLALVGLGLGRAVAPQVGQVQDQADEIKKSVRGAVL